MSDRKYLSYKFFYDDDTGNQVIKRHRSYLNPDDGTEDTPTTPLFLARIVSFDEKVTGTSRGLRHVLAFVRERVLMAKIPYSPDDSLLIDHIKEILAVERVICGDYQGEKLIKNGSSSI